MPDELIKRWQARAKKKAIKDLTDDGWDIFPSDDKRISLIALRLNEILLIRVCVNQITSIDREIINKINYKNVEIWLHKKGAKHFITHKSKTLSRGQFPHISCT